MLSGRKEFLSSCIYKIMISAHDIATINKHLKVWVSLIIEINQKNQSIHFPKAMHYI